MNKPVKRVTSREFIGAFFDDNDGYLVVVWQDGAETLVTPCGFVTHDTSVDFEFHEMSCRNEACQ